MWACVCESATASTDHEENPSYDSCLHLSSIRNLHRQSRFPAHLASRLPKRNALASELIVAVVSSLSAGFGVVALFNAVGVYV